MDNGTMLASLKVDIGITSTAYDTRLQQLLESAKRAIEIEGITLDDSIDDCNLIVMYAGWLWQKRKENVPMPRMLRYMMNNRLLMEKANG